MRRFKPFLLTVLFVLGLIGISLFIWERHLNQEPLRALTTLPTNVDMHLRGVNYSEVKEGRKEWTLKADTLRYFKSEQRLHFNNVTMAFFSLDDKELKIRSDEADYDREARLVRLKGHIQARSIEGYQLVAHEMTYNVSAKQIFIPGRFKLIGPKLTLDGTGLSLDIDRRRMTISSQARMLFKST